MNTLIFLTLGFLTSLLFPPYFITPLGFVIFPFICHFFSNKINEYSKSKIFFYIFCFGFTFFLSFLFWIKNPFLIFEETKNYFYLSIFLIIFLSLIFSILFTIIFTLIRFVHIVLLIPLIFIIFEFVIANLIYGFPWINFSLIISAIDFLSISSKYFGTLVTSYMVIQIFCLPYIFISKNLYRFELIYLISFFLVPLLVVLFTHKLFEKNNTSTKNITVELFQMNFAATNSNINLQERYNEIIKKISQSDSDIIIFAENNLPFIIENKKIERIQNIVKENQNVIIGATKKNNNRYFNTLLNISSNKIQTFEKKILVPFGEFLPFRQFLNFMENFSGPNDFTSGKKERLIHINKDLNYIPVICYEIIFYSKLININNFNSDFVINITNDIWFGELLGPYQHLYLTKLRAAELNKIIFRVSNNGISSIINNNGKILKNTKLNIEDSIKFKSSINKNKNFYKTHNILKIYLLFNFIFIVFIYFKKNNEFK